MSIRKFFNLSNLPAVKPSNSGDKLYNWKYLDSVGKLKDDSRNVYEEIQSYKNQVDYKKRIKEGENFEDGSGVYLDTTKFNGDYGDINEYLASLASNIRAQINSNTNDNGAVTSEETSQAAEVVKESAGDTSASAGINSGNEGGAN